MKTIKDIEVFEGVKILVRVDFNVPIKNGLVVDDFRIKSAFPTINYLREKGAKVILIGHLESNESSENTFKPVVEHMNKLNSGSTNKFLFVSNLRNANSFIDNEMKNGDCVLLENLRHDEGEKKNDVKFAKALASLGDIYINDAFSVSHREHASVVGLPLLLPSYAGFQLEKEVNNLSKAFNPSHPFLFILGGAKFGTKLPLLEKFLGIADTVFVGGALATDFFKVKGYEVGVSLVSEGDFGLSKYVDNPKLMLPVDIINQNNEVKDADSLDSNDSSMDHGPKTLDLLKKKVEEAKFILWNGPLGVYEKGFKSGTLALAKMIAERHGKDFESLVGGGDTIAAIAENNDEDKFSFVSTGGGAMLEFLAKGSLPGIEALG
jgi:3-phosphoglycerate kinase